MSHYKLHYFNLRAKAETIRLIFAEADVPYDDVRIDKNDWPKIKQSMPFCQVPVLEIDGTILPQSQAISKYLAREFHLDGQNNLECAFCDAYVQGAEDVNIQMRPYKTEKDPAKKESLWPEFEKQHFVPFLDRYEKFLIANGTGYFIGKDVTWADLFIFNFLDATNNRRKQNLLTNHPKLQIFFNSISNRPNIKKWIEKRPITET